MPPAENLSEPSVVRRIPTVKGQTSVWRECCPCGADGAHRRGMPPPSRSRGRSEGGREVVARRSRGGRGPAAGRSRTGRGTGRGTGAGAARGVGCARGPGVGRRAVGTGAASAGCPRPCAPGGGGRAARRRRPCSVEGVFAQRGGGVRAVSRVPLACGRAPGRALSSGRFGGASMGAAWVGPLPWNQWAGGHCRLIPRRRRTGPGGGRRLPDRAPGPARTRTPGTAPGGPTRRRAPGVRPPAPRGVRRQAFEGNAWEAKGARGGGTRGRARGRVRRGPRRGAREGPLNEPGGNGVSRAAVEPSRGFGMPREWLKIAVRSPRRRSIPGRSADAPGSARRRSVRGVGKWPDPEADHPAYLW